MKKRNLKSLQLKKKSIANMNSNKVKGGWTTIANITKSCPRYCGSVQL